MRSPPRVRAPPKRGTVLRFGRGDELTEPDTSVLSAEVHTTHRESARPHTTAPAGRPSWRPASRWEKGSSSPTPPRRRLSWRLSAGRARPEPRIGALLLAGTLLGRPLTVRRRRSALSPQAKRLESPPETPQLVAARVGRMSHACSRSSRGVITQVLCRMIHGPPLMPWHPSLSGARS